MITFAILSGCTEAVGFAALWCSIPSPEVAFDSAAIVVVVFFPAGHRVVKCESLAPEVLFDLGISSPQFDDAGRGFRPEAISFQSFSHIRSFSVDLKHLTLIGYEG